MPRSPLPIDEILPELCRVLREQPGAVIVAPPGAGKTTRVPVALAEAGIAGVPGAELLVLEPRRLAARTGARRVAEELGEKVGERVGYQVRFEDVSGPATTVRFLTEGLLTRRLLSDPTLKGVAAVAFDELHERHLHADLGLAMLLRLQQTRRPDLKLLAMSATLQGEEVAAHLGVPLLRCEGRQFPVEVEHLATPDERPLAAQVASAVRRTVVGVGGTGAVSGDLLVFLPGAAEIRRAREAILAPDLRLGDRVDLEVLHGELSAEEQDRVVRPSSRAPGARPRVILATNVAETSVTIDGVTTVIDGGWHRLASLSPWTGLPELKLARISQSSAAQRAGRAGRTAPGRCLRLYTRHDHDARPRVDVPEIDRLDLSEVLLVLARLGVTEPSGLRWLTQPAAARFAAARQLLEMLGAVGPAGELLPLGERMLGLPLHPRQARLLLEAVERGAGREGCLWAALLGERDLRSSGGPPGGRGGGGGGGRGSTRGVSAASDLGELAERFEEAARAGFDPGLLGRLGLDQGRTRAVDRARRQLADLVLRRARDGRAAPRASELDDAALEQCLLVCTLVAFPDRLARRRGEELVLCGGGTAQLAPESVVKEGPLLLALDAEERKGERGGSGRVLVRLASSVSEEMLFDVVPERLAYRSRVQWSDEGERVLASEQLCYGDLVIDEKRAPRAAGEEASRLLFEMARRAGPAAFAPEGELGRLLARLAFCQRAVPEAGLQAPPSAALEALLGEMCAGKASFAELRAESIVAHVLAAQPPGAAGKLARLAPEKIPLPSGRSARVDYPAPGEGGVASDEPPAVSSRLQDFFGMTEGPRVADGRVAVVLHLLAPNGRDVQVTRDLRSFWTQHYPALRRELGRRYPRHSWPEDPLTAPPSPGPPGARHRP